MQVSQYSVLDRSVNSVEPSELGSMRANSQIGSSRDVHNTTFVVEVDDRRTEDFRTRLCDCCCIDIA